MNIQTPQDFLTLDPIAMNVVNRVAAGARLSGKLKFDGGLLVQGEITGQTRVNGALIIWNGGLMRGRVRVKGDFYLFGQLGALDGEPDQTVVECTGMVYVAQSALSTGTLIAHRLHLYEGANVQGPFKTLKADQPLPVLRETFAETM